MAFSYFSNWDSVHLKDYLIPEMDMIFHQQQGQQPEILATNMSGFESFDVTDTLSDPFLQPQEIFYPNNTHTTLQPDIFPIEDIDSFLPIPKRQKFNTDDRHYSHHSNSHLNFSDSYLSVPEIVSEASFLPDFSVPDFSVAFENKRVDSNNVNVNNVKKPSLSAQSVAARERRRRIAEKTQRLGKLIPGGQKMNTAEMFQAAAKYVKFLQAQVGILQLMKTTQKQEGNEAMYEEEHRMLLASPAIQEKLSYEEVCLVPEKMVQALATDNAIRTNPNISEDINKLLLTNG